MTEVRVFGRSAATSANTIFLFGAGLAGQNIFSAQSVPLKKTAIMSAPKNILRSVKPPVGLVGAIGRNIRL
jgi:hypothetical protein